MTGGVEFNPESQDALRSGASPWGRGARGPAYEPLRQSYKTDALVIGGGITGALAAEHLTARGLSVIVIDKEEPGLGSTAASTAMLQWEIDSTLTELEHYYGFERAAGMYRRSAASVSGLAKLIAAHALPCAFQPRQTLYLAQNHEGARDLFEERQLRRRAGLPGVYLEHCDLFTQFELDRDAGILSPGSAEADPLQLAWGLLEIAIARGAMPVRATVKRLHSEGGKVTAELDGPFVIEADTAVLATGYSMPDIDMPKLHKVSSSFAIATVPQDPATLWRDRALIWEDAHPYLYVRTTPDHRIIAGGEDDATVDPDRRDAELAGKASIIRDKLQRLWPQANTEIATAWCGTFGETADGLPLIGPVPRLPNVYAAYGYGGNGITFSFLAAQMIGAMVAGVHRDWFDDYALDRDGPGFRGFRAGEYGVETMLR